MELDELIDQLAFGSAPKVSSSLGMYLSPEMIYVAEVHLGQGRIQVDRLLRIPVPAPEPAKQPALPTAPVTSTLNTDFLADNPRLAPMIRQALSQVRWGTRNVMVTLSHQLGLLRYFAMPSVERRFWKSAVPLEAKKYIPIPFDILAQDHQVIPLPPDVGGRPRQGVLIGVTQRKNLANISSLLESLDLKPVGLEVAPCSVLRLWESLDKSAKGRPYAQVHFDGGSIRILLVDKGFPVFLRELFLGAQAQVSDLRKVDLPGCVAFTQKLLGVEPLGQARVSGAGVELAKWREAFSSELGLPVGIQDTAGLLGLKAADWGGCAAIGAALRFLQPTTMTLDLGRAGVGDDERRCARDILLAAGLLALWFAGTGLFRTALYKFKARDLAHYRREPEVEAVFKGKGQAEIEEMFKAMEAQAELARGLEGERVKATLILKDITESLPEKVWLTQINLVSPLLKGAQITELQLSGHAVAESLGQEQDLAYQFRERLLASPVLGKLFKDIQVSVTASPLPPEAGRALDPGALSELLEKRTSFTISARAKQA